MSPDDREQPTGKTPADPDSEGRNDAPNPQTGVGIGAGEPNTFEPEEDPDAAEDPK